MFHLICLTDKTVQHAGTGDKLAQKCKVDDLVSIQGAASWLRQRNTLRRGCITIWIWKGLWGYKSLCRSSMKIHGREFQLASDPLVPLSVLDQVKDRQKLRSQLWRIQVRCNARHKMVLLGVQCYCAARSNTSEMFLLAWWSRRIGSHLERVWCFIKFWSARSASAGTKDRGKAAAGEEPPLWHVLPRWQRRCALALWHLRHVGCFLSENLCLTDRPCFRQAERAHKDNCRMLTEIPVKDWVGCPATVSSLGLGCSGRCHRAWATGEVGDRLWSRRLKSQVLGISSVKTDTDVSLIGSCVKFKKAAPCEAGRPTFWFVLLCFLSF